MRQRPALLPSLLLAAALALGGSTAAEAVENPRGDAYHSKWCGFLFLRWC